MFRLISVLFVCFVTRRCVDVCDGIKSEEELLLDYLFKDYNPSARPVINSTKTVEVNIQFSLLQIQELNVRNQVFTTTGLLMLDWRDERLAWTKTISSLDEIVVFGKNIWRPEFALINGAESIYGEYKEFQATLRSDGTLRWEPGGIFKTMCSIDITYYPFDDQRCELVFGAWSYYTTKMNLTTDATTISLATYEKNGEWEVMETSSARREFHFECCPHQRFSNIAFGIELRRRHTFYVMNVILPGILTSAVLLCIFFCIPSQKVHIGVAALLSFRLFLVNVADTIPRTSDHVPLLGVYLTCIMAITTLAMVATVFVGNLYETKGRPVPPWARRMLLGHIAPLLCVFNCAEEEEEDARSTAHGQTDEQEDKMAERVRLVTLLNPYVTGCRRHRRFCRHSSNESKAITGNGNDDPRIRRKKSLERRPTLTNGNDHVTDSISENGKNYRMKKTDLASLLPSAVPTLTYTTSTLTSSTLTSSTLASASVASGGKGDSSSSSSSSSVAGGGGGWWHVAAVCDRFFFWLCLLFVVVTTLLLFHPLATSRLFPIHKDRT